MTANVSIQTIVGRGWASKADLKRFPHTSNSVGATDDEARHGREIQQPPRNPMTLRDARVSHRLDS